MIEKQSRQQKWSYELGGGGHFKSFGRDAEVLGERARVMDEAMDGRISAQLRRRSSNAVKIAQVCHHDGNLRVSRRVHDLIADPRARIGVAHEQNDARAKAGELRRALETEARR